MSEVFSTLGIDTSNYTSSAAIFSSDFTCQNKKKILPVPQGSLGLRQNDAVFAHVKQFSTIFDELDFDGKKLVSIGVSSRPRNTEGSYMPCFLYGVSVARTISSLMNIPVYEFSHQQGHIAAAAYSCGKTDLLDSPFFCFHVSGGTTELLSVNSIENIKIVAKTNDISMGQLIDRVGVMLGFAFPSGVFVEKAAENGTLPEKPIIKLKDGNCALSGFENKVKSFIEKGVSPKDISFYIQKVAAEIIIKMIKNANSDKPVLFVGGVMSNSYIRKEVIQAFDTKNLFFAAPEYSSDNAAGIAYLALMKGLK